MTKKAIFLLVLSFSCLTAATLLLFTTTASSQGQHRSFLPFMTTIPSPELLQPYLVKDINTQSPSSFIHCPVARQNKMLCSARANDKGFELWQSNGLEGGATMVKDVEPGSESSHALRHEHSYTLLNNEVLFIASGRGQPTLWKTDGSTQSTKLVSDAFWSFPDNTTFTTVGDLVYFIATDLNQHGQEMWRSDGTTAGTFMLKDIHPGGGSSGYGSKIAYQDKLYFTADLERLWMSDGSSAGTKAVPGFEAAYVSNLAVVADKLILQMSPGDGQPLALYAGDGTAANNELIYDMGGLYVEHFIPLGDQLILAAAGSGGWSLGRSDGTAAGTELFALPQGFNYLHNPTSTATQTFFFEEKHSADQEVLWRTDGTAAGTRSLQTFKVVDQYTCPILTYAWGDKLYFSADDGTHGCELWQSDGTAAGTTLVADIAAGAKNSAPKPGVVFKNRLYLSAEDSLGDRELWRTDGTPIGTERADDVLDYPTASADPQHLIARPSGVYLSAVTGKDLGLWRSDGADHGTWLIKDYGPSPTDNPFKEAGWSMNDDMLFFITRDPEAVWRSNGTEAGTYKLSGPQECGTPHMLATVGRDTYFFAAAGGHWLCKAGFPNVKIKSTGALVTRAVAGESLLYFRTANKIGVSDGTAAGTRIYDTPRVCSHHSNMMVTLGDTLFFSAGNAAGEDCELWRLTSPSSSPQRFADINEGLRSSNPNGFLSAYGEIIFEAELWPYGQLIWRSDGTLENTFPFAQLDLCGQPSTGPSAGSEYTHVYLPALDFIGDGPRAGCELWGTDGSFDGTYLVKDIYAGGKGSAPRSLVHAGEQLFFVACNQSVGCQIWASDGLGIHTVRISDHGSNIPEQLTLAPPILFYVANSGTNGRELYAIRTLMEPQNSMQRLITTEPGLKPPAEADSQPLFSPISQ